MKFNSGTFIVSFILLFVVACTPPIFEPPVQEEEARNPNWENVGSLNASFISTSRSIGISTNTGSPSFDVSFIASASNIDSLVWSFPGGTTNDSINEIIETVGYDAYGRYDVGLAVFNRDNEDIRYFENFIDLYYKDNLLFAGSDATSWTVSGTAAGNTVFTHPVDENGLPYSNWAMISYAVEQKVEALKNFSDFPTNDLVLEFDYKLDRLPVLYIDNSALSEVAGRMSIQQGAKYLEKPQGGKGQLLGGVPGSAPAKVMIIGAGVVGTEAAKMAAGLGAQVLLLDINLDRLRYLSEILPPNVTPLYSSQETIAKNISDSDLIIGAVLIPGAKAPNIISRKMLQKMEAGTVLVDVAVDQGGCFETCQPTTHEEPTFVVDEIVHYCVANIPGAVPMTSTNALNNTTLPFVLLLANQGWKQACTNNEALKKGLSIYDGKIVHAPVANTFDLPLYDNAI
ncbi:alanine dehydrogenase [Flavobacteriaceae bacterium]|nr:alanine dehydrogenase [Flavobacteriaceae bacterium]